MKKQLRLTLLVGLLAAGCSSLSVYTNFDREANFGALETFAWKNSNQTLATSAPLVHNRIVSSIEEGFEGSGLTMVDSDPDVYIDYHTDTQAQFRVDTTHVLIGSTMHWNNHWAWSTPSGIGTSTSRVHHYEQGTLIIDVWYASNKQLIWRGSAESAIPRTQGAPSHRSSARLNARSASGSGRSTRSESS